MMELLVVLTVIWSSVHGNVPLIGISEDEPHVVAGCRARSYAI